MTTATEFYSELARVLDAMTDRRLFRGRKMLVDDRLVGGVCALDVLCEAIGSKNAKKFPLPDRQDTTTVNDDGGPIYETPKHRHARMLAWARERAKEAK
jgi:hypothetical protein